MRFTHAMFVGPAAFVAVVTLNAQTPGTQAGQAPPPSPPAGQTPQAPRVITSFRESFPTRPPADPAAVERGRALYGVNCAFCHGADTRGGDSGPSLLRAGTVLGDQEGGLIGPGGLNGRTARGVPKVSFPM